MCVYFWVLFTFVTCLLVLDQIIEDRKRRVQLEVLLVLLQLLCSIFRVLFVLLEDCVSSYSFGASLASVSEYRWGCCM